MLPKIEKIEGVHPGYILERELKERNVKKNFFARSIDEYEQVISDITKAKRRVNPSLALKLDRALNTPQSGYFMLLQTYYDLERARKEYNKTYCPDLSKFRRVLFWDTNIENIDWDRNKRFVIERVFARGNEIEKSEIIRFYGQENIDEILKNRK